MKTTNIKAEAIKTVEMMVLSDMRKIKAWKPYRIVWCAIHPETLELIGPMATVTKHGINKHLRAGYQVYTV